MISALRQAYEANKLPRIERDFSRTLDKLMKQEWVVFSKAYLQRPETIINYLGCYTHKIAIDDSRILSEKEGIVDFAYKDYRDGDRRKRMRLPLPLPQDEFICRFLLHILPSGFMRIRHYGFLANCCRQKKLSQIIEGIEGMSPATSTTEGRKLAPTAFTEDPPCHCPKCKTGQLNVIKILPQSDGAQ